MFIGRQLFAADVPNLDTVNLETTDDDVILELEQFPLDSVFNENAIMLEALQSDIKAYSEQLGVVAQRYV